MASYDDGEDYGSDLDDLEPEELEKLEGQAIHFTQATQTLRQPHVSKYGDLEGDDLDNAEVYDETQTLLPELPSQHTQNFGQSTQQEQFRRNRYGGGPRSNSITHRPINSSWRPPQPRSRVQTPAPIRPQQPHVNKSKSREEHVQSSVPPLAAGPDVEVLQKQIQEVPIPIPCLF